jgi:hypothetical protein
MRFRILNWKNFYTTAAYHLQLLTRKQQQLRIEKQIAIAYIFKSAAIKWRRFNFIRAAT